MKKTYLPWLIEVLFSPLITEDIEPEITLEETEVPLLIMQFPFESNPGTSIPYVKISGLKVPIPPLIS